MIAALNIKLAVQNWWERKRREQRFRQAVTRAYAAFAVQYPHWAAALFDRHFLTHEAAFLLARVGQGAASPRPIALVSVWSRQMSWFREETRQEIMAELRPAAADFLRWLETELRSSQGPHPSLTRQQQVDLVPTEHAGAISFGSQR